MLEQARKWPAKLCAFWAIAYKPNAVIENAETEMTLLGLVGMIDPPRPEAKAAVGKCEEPGSK